jgi:HK97 family phage portal protein
VNVIDRLFRKEKRSFFPETQQVITSSIFTEDTNPTVLACVNKVANTLSELKLDLYSRKKGSGRILAVNHPLFSVLKNPAPEETPTLFYNTMVRHLLLKGNAYIYIGRNPEGKIVSFSIVNPDNVLLQRDSSFQKYFTIAGKSYTSREILHIPYMGQGYDGTKGRSPIDMVQDLIKLDNELLAYTKNYFNNSVGTRVAMELGENWPVKTAELEKVYASIIPLVNKYVTGAGNAGKVMIPPPDTKLTKIDQPSNVEAELHSLLQMVEKQIAQAFSVPYDLITGENKYNSLEQRQANFLSECIQPLGNHICQSFEKLLSPSDGNLYVAYNYKSLLMTDTKTTIDVLTKELGWGTMNINEARAKLDMTGIGDVGDYYFFPAGYTPLTVDNINAFFAQSKAALQELPESHNPAGDDKN